MAYIDPNYMIIRNFSKMIGIENVMNLIKEDTHTNRIVHISTKRSIKYQALTILEIQKNVYIKLKELQGV